MPEVLMPDGVTVEFPDSMSADEMKAASRRYCDKHVPAKHPEAESDPDYWRTFAQGVGSIPGTLLGCAAGPGGAIAGGALTGSMAGQAYDLGKAWLNEQPLPGFWEQTDKAVNDVAMDMAVPIVGAKALSMAGNAAKTALSPVKSYAKSRVGPTGVGTLKKVQQLEQAGFKTEVGMLDNVEAQQLSQSLRNMPASGKVMQEVDRHNWNRANEIFTDLTSGYGIPADTAELGRRIKGDMAQAESRFFDGADKLYGKVAEFIPDRIPANNIVSEIDGIMGPASESALIAQHNAEAINSAKLALQDIAEDGTMSKRGLDIIKKHAASAYRKNPAARTDADRILVQFERAADKDITEAAMQAGGPKAAEAVRRAKLWWKLGKGNKQKGVPGLLDDATQVKKFEQDGAAYDWIFKGKKQGTNRLNRMFGNLSPETAADIRATEFRKLGMTTPGNSGGDGATFSFDTFLTRWNDMNENAPEAARFLFGDANDELKTLLDSAGWMKSLSRHGNFSNTANKLAWQEVFKPITQGFANGGAYGGLPGAVKGAAFGTVKVGADIATNSMMAKFIADPECVKWLAETSKRVLFRPTDLTPQLMKLADMARRSPEKAEHINEYLNSFTQNNTARQP